MKEVAKLVAVQVTDELTLYGYLMNEYEDADTKHVKKFVGANDPKEILVRTLYECLKSGEKAKGRKTGITRKDIEKIVERELKHDM